MKFTDVVLDTSAIFLGRPISEVNAIYLRHFSGRSGATVWIPSVVVSEALTLVAERTEQERTTLLKARRSLDELGVNPGLFDNEGAYQARAAEAFQHRLLNAGIRTLELPKDLGHAAVLERLQAGRKPFRGGKERDVGYRDCLIWESLLSLGISERTRNLAFVTANTRDFSNGQDQDPALDADLQAEAAASNLSVTLFFSLRDFIASVVKPDLPVSEQVSALLRTAKWQERLWEWLEIELPRVVIGADVRDELTWQGVRARRASIEDTAGVDPDIEVLSVRQVERDFVGEIRVRFGALLELYLSREEMANHGSVDSAGSKLWSESEYGAQEDIALLGTFDLLIKKDDQDGLTFVSARLTDVYVDLGNPALD